MTTMRGHSRPVKIPLLDNVLDHTYVTCAAGHCWPCWGDCLDGSILTTGEGSSARSEAIAEPDAQAGIRYGVTGLCTQTANRILWPAGITVAEAMGYEFTDFFFGTYGPSALDWIAHRDASTTVSGETPKCDGTEAPEENPSSDTATALFSFIIGLYERFARSEERTAEPAPNLDLLNEVLAARLEAVLGPRFSEGRTSRLQEIQRAFMERKMPLDRSLLTREMSGREFAEAANGLINEALRQVAEVLDRESYARFFNMRPGAEVTVIRPDICEEQYDGGARGTNA